MAGKYENFKSQSTIKAQEEELQKARELVLKKAKAKYDAEEKRIERAKKAGEGTWMLDSLSKRLDNEKKVLENAKKKKKKEKKKKKKKEKKKKRSNSSSSSSSDDDDDGDEPTWVEKGKEEETKSVPAPIKGPQLQRDSWMEAPLDFLPLTSRQELRERINQEKAKAKREANKMLEPGKHVRELNPYWKNGGTGLPPEKPKGQDSIKDVNEKQREEEGLKSKFARPKDNDDRYDDVSYKHRGDSDRKFSRPKEDDDYDNRYKERRNISNSSRRFARPRDDDSDNDSDKYRNRRERDKDDRRENGKRDNRRDYSYRDDRRDGSYRDDRGSSGRYGSTFAKPKDDDDDDEDSSRSSLSRRGHERRDSSDVPRWKKSAPSPGDHRKDRVDEKGRNERQRLRSSSSSSSDSETRSKDKKASGGKFARPENSSDEDSKERSQGRSPVRDHLPKWKKQSQGDSRGGESRRKSPQRSSSDVPRWKKKLPTPDRKESEESEIKEKNRNSARKRSPSSSSSSEGSSSESESDSAQKEEITKMAPVKIMSEEEMNDLAAKILRFEIMGEDDMAAELKSKLEEARKQREAARSGTNAAPDFSAKRPKERQPKDRKRKSGENEKGDEEDNVVVLSRTNKAGMVRPVFGEATETWGGRSGKKRKKNVATHDTSGMRTIYFDNDDKFDLKTLVEQEKAGTAEDQNSMFARLAGRSADKDLDVDDMFVSRAAKKQDDERIHNKEKAAAIFEHRKQTSAMEKCQRCLKQVPKHLIIALGTKSYLCLPHHRSLTEGHCLIVPMVHASAATALDEDVWQEMQLFRKSIVRMFAEQDQDVVIMETVMHLKHFPHTALECVPLDRELGDMAPIYFKKAIQEAGPEWSDNKKLHDLRGKDVRRVIPKGFPYFAVDFGADSGFATVVEDESSFPSYFGREIVGGMLDAEPSLWRKPHKQSFEDQRQKVLQFEKWWKPYDWTIDLSNAT